MTNDITVEDVSTLVKSMVSILDAHGVSDKIHYSIISDVLFDFSSLIDRKQNTNLHENIYTFLESCENDFDISQNRDYLVAEIKIRMNKKGFFNFNILKSQLDNQIEMQFNIEIELGLRQLHEIDEDIDTESRFKSFLEQSDGIQSVKYNFFNPEQDDEIWLELDINSKPKLADLVSLMTEAIKSKT